MSKTRMIILGIAFALLLCIGPTFLVVFNDKADSEAASTDTSEVETTITDVSSEVETIDEVTFEPIDTEPIETTTQLETTAEPETYVEEPTYDTEPYVEDPLPEITEPYVAPEPVQDGHNTDTISGYLTMTYDERWLFACLIWLESGTESVECQYAVGSVVINRMVLDGLSLYDVAYTPGQFDVAPYLTSAVPGDLQLQIAEDLCRNGPTIPLWVTFFRANRFFTREEMYVNDYIAIDHVYFSYDPRVRDRVEGN